MKLVRYSQCFLLVEVYQRLGFDYCHLIRVGVEGVDVKFVPSCLEIDVAKRLEPVYRQFGEPYENAAIACEAFEVDVTFAVEICAHFLDLKIGHVTESATKGAFVVPVAAELESLDESSLGKHLSRNADQLCKTKIAGEDAHHMRTAGNPDNCFVLFCLEMSFGMNIKKLRM